MIVLTRQINETVYVGDGQTITLLRIRGDKATLRVEVAFDNTELSDEVTLTRDESTPLPTAGKMTVVDIRGDVVRLGFEVPKDVPVHRAEVYEALQRESRAAAPSRSVIADRSRLALSTGQMLWIGKLTLEATDIDTGGVRFKVRGELVGGAEDGAIIDTVKELGAKGELNLGTRVTVTLLHVSGTLAHVMVVKPPTMRIEVK